MNPTKSASAFIAGALSAIVIVGGMQIAAATSTATIHACEAKSNGALRIAAHCTKKEKAISWNQKGSPGPKGKAGTAGAVAAYTAVQSGIVGLDNTYKDVVSLAIPAAAAGHYLLLSNPGIQNQNTGETNGYCQITGAGLDVSIPWGGSGSSGGIVHFNPSGTYPMTVPAAGATVALTCSGQSGVAATGSTLAAIRVSTLG